MLLQSVITLLISLLLVDAFRVVDPIHSRKSHTLSGVLNSKSTHTKPVDDVLLKLCVSFALLPVNQVLAKDGELGFLEGKTVALIHPVIMIGLFGVTLYK